MSANSITFRCYQCQKLLGASRSRVGSVVNCPKCGAELLVPEPEEEAAVESAPGSSTVEPGFPAGLFQTEPQTAPSQTPPSFFPEIRTEPAPAPPPAESPFAFLQTGAAAEPAAQPPQPFPFVNTGAPASPPPAAEKPRPKRPKPKPAPPAAPPPAEPGSSEVFFANKPSFPAPSVTDEGAAQTMEYNRSQPAPRGPAPEVAPSVMAWPTPAPSSPPVVPAIATEPEPLREVASRPRLADREELPRRNDVSIPRTAVVLWSFFVLLALIAAFVAGVFLGHFVWH